MTTRRAFLGATPAAALWSSFAGSLQAAGSPINESFWSMVRSQFPLDPAIIYLNAANVCPASRLVIDRHLEYLRDFHANPSFQNRDKYVQLRESLRSKAAAMLRVSADEIAITRNTSEANNIIVQGIDLKAGEEVVITDHNHPSNREAWQVRARRHGFIVKSVPVAVPARSVDELAVSIEKAITPKTRVIAVTHVTSTTGILYPARRIAELARSRGVHFHLDGAQTFGGIDVDLRELGCDSYSASAHKWPMGPLENGILYLKADRIGRVWPSIVTAGWAEDLKGARKFEVFGQRDDPRIVALESAVDFLNLVGMTNVEARVRMLCTRAKNGLAQLSNVELKTNREADLSGGVVKFRLRNKPTKQAYDTLWNKHRLAIAMTASGDSEGLRFSPHVYNSPEEIDRAIEAVKSL
jgi:selenocysteine lyase/cysteine desulfurase